MGIRISPSFSFLIEMIRLTTSTYTPRIKLVKPEIWTVSFLLFNDSRSSLFFFFFLIDFCFLFL
jgi:hypothetical protein